MHRIFQKSLKETCHHLSKIKTETLLLVIDKKVEKLYGKRISIKGKKIIKWIAPQGELAKSFSAYEKCLSFFLKQNLSKNIHLVAIGGGATSDLAGFVASTLYRGISWSVVPTTLLSMIDASLGGKTGINFQKFKNQLGTIHFPENIFVDLDFLKTLPREEMLSGQGELLKYFYLSPKLALLFKRKGLSKDLISACLKYKNEIVKKDPYEEKNQRIFLNFGHTLGHAFERLWGLPHGLAIACGIGEMLRLFGTSKDVELWHERMHSLGFDIQMERLSKKEIDILIHTVGYDKKRFSKNEIQILIPKNGKVLLRKIKLEDLRKRLYSLYGY